MPKTPCKLNKLLWQFYEGKRWLPAHRPKLGPVARESFDCAPSIGPRLTTATQSYLFSSLSFLRKPSTSSPVPLVSLAHLLSGSLAAVQPPTIACWDAGPTTALGSLRATSTYSKLLSVNLLSVWATRPRCCYNHNLVAGVGCATTMRDGDATVVACYYD